MRRLADDGSRDPPEWIAVVKVGPTRGPGRIVLVAALGMSLFVALGADSPQSARSPRALLEVGSDRVLVAAGGRGATVVVLRAILASGDAVGTDQTGTALVTFEDGSTIELGTDSAFRYVVVTTGLGNVLVLLTQSAGRIWYTIARTLWPGARYEVAFPGGAAVVRAGTSFETDVDADGNTTITPTEGTVAVTSAGTTVEVSAGRRGVVRAGAAPVSEPAPARASPSPSPSPSPSTPASQAPSSDRPLPSAAGTPTASPSVPPSLAPTPTPSHTPTGTPTPSLLAVPTPDPSASPLPSASLLPTPAQTIAPLPTASLIPAPTLPPLLPLP